MEENLSREARAAAAKSVKFQYSPAFISADDAARYVHERIGNKRDVEYGSVILRRRSDGRIFATEPVPGRAATFDFEQLLERGAGNAFVDPPGYQLVGGLHSHPERFAALKSANPRLTERQVRIFNGFYSDRDVVFNHYEGRALVVAYLSGPNGELLKYEPSGSPAERQLVDWIDDVRTALPEHGHDGTLEGVIKKLAAVGRLSLVVSNADWGGATGVIDERWQPYLPLTATQDTVACGPLYPDVARALSFAQARMRRQPDVRQMVVLLKHEQRNAFVATEPLALGAGEHVPADQRLPSLPGGPLLPEGFHVHGFFFVSQPVAAQIPTREPQVYQQFFSPGELAAYIAKARRYQQAPTSALGISLYMRTQDHALLRYRFSGSPAESQLFRVDEAGVVSDQGNQQALDRGTLTPRQYVIRVADAGELSVEQTSALWDVAGVVETDWVPFQARSRPTLPSRPVTGPARVPLPPLSPAFIQPDDAAFWAHRQIGARRDVEYGGVILRNLHGYFFATEPRRGGSDVFDVRTLLNRAADGSMLAPAGYRLTGLYHSHPAIHTGVAEHNPQFTAQQVKAFVNFFSIGDVVADIHDRKSFPLSYLSGPDNSLIRYKPSGSALEARVEQWRRGTLSVPPVAYDGSLEADIKVLASVGELSFVIASDVWGGSRGVVPAHWQPYTAFVQPTTAALPLLSQVCTQITEAIEAGVEGSTGGRDAWRLGLILKRDGKDEFVATCAQVRNEPRFYVTHLLSTDADGNFRLPDEHRIVGFYCEPPTARSRVAVYQPWLYRSFFPALGLASAAQQAGLIANLQVPDQPLGLYQRSAGGALLRYQFSYSGAETELTGDAAATDSAMLDGSLTPQAFVLKVAAAGVLTVLATNRVWDREGVVTADWRPFSNIPPVVVGPSFITPDDAARWAHNQIGTRRDREYGGLVLKRGNRYFATPPVSGDQALFDFGTILARDDEDDFIAPDGYECHGLYHSHPANDGPIKQFNPSFTADQVELFNSFYSNADQVFAITHRDFARVHYLSGAPNALLKYVSSGSAEEANLKAQLLGTVPLVEFSTFEGAVWRLAQAGELRVVVPSPVWGGVRGKVSQGWTLRSPVSDVQEQPFFTPAVGTAQAAVLVALNVVARLRQSGYQGVVLKHLTSSTYIATEPTALGASLTGLFPLRDNGQPRLPSNYRLVGFYYAPAPLADMPLPATEPWLYKRFVSPQLLVTAMNQAASTQGLQMAGMGLKLFLHTADKALLQWQAPAPGAASELFSVAADGTVTDNGNQAALMDGSLSPRAFVQRVIHAGELTVLQVGRLWNTLGLLYASETLPLGTKGATVDATFLSADDAARHAHERIGVRREAIYAGYILRRPDQRFVFTEPVRVHGDGFAGDLLLSAPGNGLLVPPAGHVIHARYSSHPPLSQDELERWRRLGWSMTDLEISATMFSDRDIRSVIRSGLPAYLSGSPNSLICYIPSGSQNEALVLANTSREPSVDGYYRRLERGALKPENIVTRLADAGELRVVARTRLWGPRLRVYDDWTPNFDYAETPPQTPALSAVFKTLDAAAINAHVRGHGRNLDIEGYTAYLLKHPQKNEYVVSELAPQASGRWLSDSSLGAAYLNGGDFTHGFVMAGLLYSQQWLPSGLPSTAAWLTRFFATPQRLQRAEQDVRYLPRASAGGVLPVYLSTLEGALLRYQPAETSLFSGGEEGEEVSVQGMRLRSGTLDIRRYVTAMAQSGDLTVLYSSQCWDRRGAVSKDAAQWRPYAHFNRRRLGPVFNDQDDAARYARSRLTAANARRLFGGLILKRPDGLFVATEPVSVPSEDFDHTWIFPDEIVGLGGFPAAHTLVARYRSSPGRELPFALDATQRDIYRNMLSTRVIGAALAVADTHLTREYLFGSDGCILSYSRSDTALEKALKDELRPLNLVREDRLENRLEQQIRAGELKPEAFVRRLSEAGSLRVVEGSKVWGAPRLVLGFVPNAYRAAAIEIESAQAEPAFSPVFAQEEAAVRYAHEQCQYGSALQFGYVFKAARKEQYMVTMPLVRGSYWKYTQVFPNGLLPQGYVLEGLYLCAALQNLTPGQDTHERTFHSPLDIDNGIRFSRRGVKGKTLSLYVSCPEGALIRYQYLDTEEMMDSRSHFPTLRQKLHEGNISVLDYVRDLAQHGNLDVLVEGSVWAGTRRITPEWKPGSAEGFVDYPMGCGPLFSHADDAARYVQRRLSTRMGHNYVAAVLANPSDSSFITTLPLWPGLDATRLFRLFYTGPSGPVQPISRPVGGPAPFPDFPDLYRVIGAQLIYRDKVPAGSEASRDEALASHFIELSVLSDFIRILKAQRQASTSLYLVTRGGALLKYVPGFSPLENQLMASGPNLKLIEFLDQLAGVGQLSVLDRDAYWHSEGLFSEMQTDSRNGIRTDEPQTDEPLQLRDRDEL